MKLRLILIGLCNIIDLLSTLHLTSQGFKELNPLMALVLRYPPLFVIVKLAVMTWALVTIWQNRETKTMVRISWFAMILYAVIALYYIPYFVILLLVY